MSAAKEVQQEREREREFEREQRFLQAAFNQRGELDQGWMREIIGTEDLEDHLQTHTITKIQALLNKDWVLSNLTEAETHDRKHWLKVMEIKILGQHPPSESAIVGPVRAFLFDDPEEDLWPLTPQERQTINQIISGLQNRVTRSRGGFERKQQQTSIARTESESNQSGEKKGRLKGLFG